MNRVLDTNTVLYLLGGRLAEPLHEAYHFVSVITEMELLSYPLIQAEEESRIKDFLSDVTVAGLTEKIKHTAINFRKIYRLKLPDAIIAATALALKAELLTNDLKLANIAGLSVKLPLLK